MKLLLILFILGVIIRELEPKDKRIDLIDNPDYDSIYSTIATVILEVMAIIIYPIYKLLLYIWNE